MRFTTTLVLAAALAGVTFAGASGQERIDGAAIAKKGLPNVRACESCHTGAEAPLLNGQLERYIAQQLSDFRNGFRLSEACAPNAKGLNEKQSAAVAKYFNEQPRKKAPVPDADAALIEKGKALVVDGDVLRDIFPCSRCHGTDGVGGDFAALAGQNPAYTLKQIQNLRAGKRDNDELGIMQAISQKLTDDDVKAAAAYFHQAVK